MMMLRLSKDLYALKVDIAYFTASDMLTLLLRKLKEKNEPFSINDLFAFADQYNRILHIQRKLLDIIKESDDLHKIEDYTNLDTTIIGVDKLFVSAL